MTVRLAEDATLQLEGDCPIEDAEVLLRHLLETPGATVDWRACERLHSAVVQVLLASGAPLKGPPAGAFLRDWLEPVLLASADRTALFPKGVGMP
jgi:hypothetical protein